MTMTTTTTQWADPAQVATNVYHLILENDRVRVFDVRFKPGAVAKMHGHPDHVAYFISDMNLHLVLPEGAAQDISVQAGQALFIPAGPHEATNLGAAEGHALVVELKK
jgi:quercetin dioxygenase-like cupin family protein